MWWRALLVGGFLAGLLGACAVVDPVDSRYDTVARSLAKARNEAIFLNLVRASHDYPLSFTTIANVTPTMTNTTSLGLPSFLEGPGASGFLAKGAATTTTTFPTSSPFRDFIFGNTTASNATSIGTNFNISTQETGAFYDGFLKPIDLQTLDYFIRQGYPRELLFWLFTDSFEVSSPKGILGYRYNPPDSLGCDPHDPRHRCFIDWVHIATLSGLTVEEKTMETSGGRGGGGSGGGASSGSSGKPTTYTYARFCFNKIQAEQAAALVPQSLVAQNTKNLDLPLSALYDDQHRCGGTWDPETTAEKAQPDILPLEFGPIKFRIIPRSAYGVFEFLGQLMKLEQEHYVPDAKLIPSGRTDIGEPPVLATVHEDPHLMTVLQNIGGDCFVHTWFNDGDYCVPEEATTTKRVFGLLAQLIAIQTATTDLSITPIVRVIQ
jgi:hypothetical protein